MRRSRPCSGNRGSACRSTRSSAPTRSCSTSCGKYRGELGVTALPQELAAAAAETRRFLGARAATLEIAAARRTRGAELELTLDIASTTGHKLPTAYPSRRAWLHVIVKDEAGRVVFESGAPQPDGSIAGNDNDADPGAVRAALRARDGGRPGADLRSDHGR